MKENDGGKALEKLNQRNVQGQAESCVGPEVELAGVAETGAPISGMHPAPSPFPGVAEDRGQ